MVCIHAVDPQDVPSLLSEPSSRCLSCTKQVFFGGLLSSSSSLFNEPQSTPGWMKQLPVHLEASLKVNRKLHEKMAKRIRVCRRLAFHPCEHNTYSEIVLQLLFQEMKAARRCDFLSLASSTLTHTKHLMFLLWSQPAALIHPDQLMLWKHRLMGN